MTARFPAGLAAGWTLLVLVPAVAPAQSVLSRFVGVLGRDDYEITPDGRYAVGRPNAAFQTRAEVLDLATGTEASTVVGVLGLGYAGPAVDAVAVTDTRAVVLGPSALVLDLTSLANPILAEHQVGERARDVAITPDGTKALVRGGSGVTGGQYAIDLATGVVLASHPGNEPPPYPTVGSYSFDVDSVVASDTHAVMTSIVLGPAPRTRVTLWELSPASGGAPAVALETDIATDLLGGPYDIALTPDATKAVVRSERRVGVWDLSVSPPASLFVATPNGDPGGFQEQALDAVEVTDTLIVTLARNGATGTQVEVFDMTGQSAFERIAGSPHDLALTPDGTRAVVRTSAGVFLYDLTQIAFPALTSAASVSTPAGSTAYLAGLDSVVANDRFAVTLTRVVNLAGIDIWIWDIRGGALESVRQHRIGNSRPTDLELTPDGERVVVTGTNGVSVLHLASGVLLFNDEVTAQNSFYPWCDGLAANDTRAVAFGYSGAQGGWYEVLDIGRLDASFCASLPNSTGVAAHMSAYGTASVAANDLVLVVDDAPKRTFGRFLYAPVAGTPTPFGDGVLCLGGGTPFQLPVVTTTASGGAASFPDLTSPPLPGGLVTPGSTWSFQFLYRNAPGGPSGFNLSDGVTITFAP